MDLRNTQTREGLAAIYQQEIILDVSDLSRCSFRTFYLPAFAYFLSLIDFEITATNFKNSELSAS